MKLGTSEACFLNFFSKINNNSKVEHLSMIMMIEGIMDQNLMLTPTPIPGFSPGMIPGVTVMLGVTGIEGPTTTGPLLFPPNSSNNSI